MSALNINKASTKLKAPTPTPEAIVKLTEKPLVNVVAPPVGFSQGNPTDMRIALIERALSKYDLAVMESIAPDEASKIESLLSQLATLKKVQATETSEAESKIRNLREVENKIAMQLAREAGCSMMMHKHSQMEPPNIGGQFDGYHNFVGVCLICGQNFKGVGDEKGQVPRHIWNQLDFDKIGSAA